MTCCSIQPSPPHTRPWRPRHQSGCCTNQCLRQRRLSSVPRPRPGGRDRLRLASCSWFVPSKPDHWNPTNNSHSTERYRISLIQNLKKQSPFSIYIFADNSTRSEMNDETTAPPNFKLVTVTGCPGHDIFHQIAAAFSGAHHTPVLGALVANLVVIQIDVRDGLVDFKCLGQGLEAATDQGWRLVRGPFGQNLISEMLKKKTFNLDMSNLSDSKLGKTIQKSTVSFSIYIQLDWEYLTTQLDPRWTMKLQHLQTIQTCHCQRMSKTWHHDMLQHSAEPTTHQALAPSAPIWLLYKSMFATEAFIFSASAKAWRQGQIKVGILFVVSTVKTWSLKSHEQFTFNWEISNLSDSKIEKTIPIQHLHICWQLNSIRDERWNYSTSKLQTCHCHRMSKTWHHDMQHSAIQWSPPHTRPWRPRHQSGSLPNRCSWWTCWF